MKHRFTLTLFCPDQTGIVAAVSSFLAAHNGSILESSQHSDPIEGYFFMRVEIDASLLNISYAQFKTAFSSIADRFDMTWQLFDSKVKHRVVVLVSKQDHCLADILYRWRNQDIEFDIPCVISNHEDMRSFVEWHGIPYHHIPMNSDNKQQAFDQIEKLFEEYAGDTMVLARFMQILPKALCEKYFGKLINIHHSFLPSFVGAKPYHQAYDRGVKLTGATCHYVTEELDAGPIIEQDVIRIDHGHSIEDLVRLGKDVEKTVLARGLHLHLQNRVVIHKNKTIVFD